MEIRAVALAAAAAAARMANGAATVAAVTVVALQQSESLKDLFTEGAQPRRLAHLRPIRPRPHDGDSSRTRLPAALGSSPTQKLI